MADAIDNFAGLLLQRHRLLTVLQNRGPSVEEKLQAERRLKLAVGRRRSRSAHFVGLMVGRCIGCNGDGCRNCDGFGYKKTTAAALGREPFHPADAWTLAKLQQIPVGLQHCGGNRG